MRIHPREFRVERAESELKVIVSEFLDDKDLTIAERIRILASVSSSLTHHATRYMIRMERHNDPDREGGLDFSADEDHDRDHSRNEELLNKLEDENSAIESV